MSNLIKTLTAADRLNAEVNSRLARLPGMSGGKGGALVNCACGCFGKTQRRFVPGHDAKLLGWCKRVERGIVDIREIAISASSDPAEAVSIARAVCRELDLDFNRELGLEGGAKVEAVTEDSVTLEVHESELELVDDDDDDAVVN